MNIDNAISDVLRNTIHAISQGYIFEVEYMFLHILMDSAQCPNTIKVFTPWFQKVVDYSMKTEYLAKISHKSFIPPVRDTLKVMEDFSSGKAHVASPDYHNTFHAPKLPKRDLMPNTQPPSHLEVSMRTQ